MLARIETVEDVKIFAKQIINEGVSFHPDDDFNEYLNLKTNIPIYNLEEAEVRNNLMNECFEICNNSGVDIYEIMYELTLTETGLDKFIPLPSNS
jgi:hypothetical protein